MTAHLAKGAILGNTYLVRDGRHHGRLVKVIENVASTSTAFVKVILLDAWGKPTKEVDVIPLAHIA
jgi:hypothetical protein